MRARLAVAALLLGLGGIGQAGCGQASLSTSAPDAPKCQVTVDGATPSAPANGGAGTVAVTTTRDCTWAVTTDASWISITSDRTGQGSGTVGYRVDANPQPANRRGTIHINDTAVAVSQDAALCKFAVSPLNAAVSAGGGTVVIAIQTLTGCKWTVAADEAWLHVAAGSGDGNGSIQVTADANAGAARTGHARIADQTVTIDEAALPPSVTPTPPTPTPPPGPAPTPPPPPAPQCHYNLAPNNQSVPAAGGSNAVQVQTDNGCAWTATSNSSWISITRGASGTGNGNVEYTANANSGAARSGTLSIAGQTFTVTQAAAPPPCSYSISPTSQSLDATGGSGTVAVTSSSGCAWTASSNASWITITTGASGSGNGSVAFNVAANSGGGRSGTLTIAGQTFTVSQASAPQCNYAISPTSQSVDANGGSGTVAVTSGNGCSWRASSNAPWITISSGGSGSGNGSVAFSVAPNNGVARSGTLTVAGQTFTIAQAAPAPACSYTISPTSGSAAPSGGSTSVAVTAGSSCSWTATSNADWISVTSGASGTGNGSVAISIAQNGTGAARSGTATIAGQTFTVTQSGS
jgi:hypothetical protein